MKKQNQTKTKNQNHTKPPNKKTEPTSQNAFEDKVLHSYS